ncbi:MAG: carboxypeptidase-like regulatory domain-containing protein [Terriglobia bacterium]
MVRRKVCALLLLISAIVFSCVPALAQTNTVSIVGTVTDSPGAVALNAAETVTNMGTNLSVKTTTDAAGDCVVAPLPVGRYSVVCEAQGFKTETQPGVTVDVQSHVEADFVRQVGTASETIEVHAANPRLPDG